MASSFNRVILMGNLTRDPEVRQAQSGTYVVRFGLAINERAPDGQGGYKEEASFIDCTVFGKRGEAFSRFMRKGSKVLIEGKLRQGRWQDRETGQSRSKIEVIVDSWNFAGGRSEEGQQDGGGWGAPRENPDRARAIEDAMGGNGGFPDRSDFDGGPARTGGGASFPDDVPF